MRRREFITSSLTAMAYVPRGQPTGSINAIGGEVLTLPRFNFVEDLASEMREAAERTAEQRTIYGGSLKGAFRIPHNAIKALGNGDPEAGLAVSDQIFGHHVALGRGLVHPDVVRDIGDGDLAVRSSSINHTK